MASEQKDNNYVPQRLAYGILGVTMFGLAAYGTFYPDVVERTIDNHFPQTLEDNNSAKKTTDAFQQQALRAACAGRLSIEGEVLDLPALCNAYLTQANYNQKQELLTEHHQSWANELKMFGIIGGTMGGALSLYLALCLQMDIRDGQEYRESARRAREYEEQLRLKEQQTRNMLNSQPTKNRRRSKRNI